MGPIIGDKMMKMLKDAESCWRVALKAVDPDRVVKGSVRVDGQKLIVGNGEIRLGEGRLMVAAVGKTSTGMSKAFMEVAGKHVDRLLVVYPSNAGAFGAPEGAELIAAAHPLPDAGSLEAGIRLGRMADELGEKDTLILLISGGGSALACAPVEGLDFADKAAANKALVLSGADIHAINRVRKHLSAIKGGRLAARAFPARVVSLIVSDVIGDDPSTIASGPTAPDPSTFRQALEVCSEISVPKAVSELLRLGAEGSISETPKPGDFVFKKISNFIVASNRLALEAAVDEAGRLGYSTAIATDRIRGEARLVGQRLGALLKSLRPGSFVALGGETTVTVTGDGRGGRCQELALAAAIEIDGIGGRILRACGTDGIDGPTDAAGAWVDGATMAMAQKAGLAPTDFLSRNDAYTFLHRLSRLIVTGPTGVNVMDMIFIVSEDPD